ncbi:MAG: hypothetical protein A2X46_09195 [Lentisphaerae bacterium GWF2_57_35]|nr:MAG: hypothetical protein A2X46_09195 [Lentisphaerae bacterium GWF2_57_35]
MTGKFFQRLEKAGKNFPIIGKCARSRQPQILWKLDYPWSKDRRDAKDESRRARGIVLGVLEVPYSASQDLPGWLIPNRGETAVQ